MVRVDGQWNRLKAVQKAGFKAPADHFRKASRLAESTARAEDFPGKLEAAGRQAELLRQALRDLAVRPGEPSLHAAEAAFLAVSKACTDCHMASEANDDHERADAEAGTPLIDRTPRPDPVTMRDPRATPGTPIFGLASS